MCHQVCKKVLRHKLGIWVSVGGDLLLVCCSHCGTGSERCWAAGDAIRGEAAIDGWSGSCIVKMLELIGSADGKNCLDNKGRDHGGMFCGGATGHNWAWSQQSICLCCGNMVTDWRWPDHRSKGSPSIQGSVLWNAVTNNCSTLTRNISYRDLRLKLKSLVNFNEFSFQITSVSTCNFRKEAFVYN